jgi:hypothetical protein
MAYGNTNTTPLAFYYQFNWNFKWLNSDAKQHKQMYIYAIEPIQT